MNDFLNQLEYVKKVETPSFLYTRIEQRIKTKISETASPKAAISFVVSLLLIVLINVFVCLKYNKKTEPNVVEAFHLSTSNTIYND